MIRHDTGYKEGSSDLEIVRGARAGDPEAIDSLLDRLRCVPRILHAKNRRLGAPLSPEDMADLAQDVLSTVWRKIDGYHGGSPLVSWLYSFCTLSLMDMLKRRRRRPRLATIDDTSLPSDDEEPDVDDEAVQAALAALPKREEAVVRMKHYEELTFREISDRVGEHPSTVKTTYYRGVDILRRLLSGEPEAAS